jgi:hypothetical protein
MKKLTFIFLFIGTCAFSQSAGNSGLSFLKFGFGARNIAMGDIGVVANNDLTALNYNPSLLAVNNNAQLSFTHNSLYQDLSSEMLAGSFKAFGLPIAVGVNTTNIDNIEVRTKPGPAESTFNAHFFYASISTAQEVFGNLFAGVTYKYLYENIFSDDATGYSFDFGLTYTKLIDGLDLGVSLRNLGSMNNLRSESTKLPTDLRLGASYNFSLPDYKLEFTAVGGFQKYTLEDESHIHFGGEAVYDKMFSLRAGYLTGYDSKNISVGFGVRWKGINLDYAYVPVKFGLGDSHIITIIYSFQ